MRGQRQVRFWLKAISSKTECENLVSPPLDGSFPLGKRRAEDKGNVDESR